MQVGAFLAERKHEDIDEDPPGLEPNEWCAPPCRPV